MDADQLQCFKFTGFAQITQAMVFIDITDSIAWAELMAHTKITASKHQMTILLNGLNARNGENET
jgi:hypothetical protein